MSWAVLGAGLGASPRYGSPDPPRAEGAFFIRALPKPQNHEGTMDKLAILLKQRSREGRNGWRLVHAQSRLKLAVVGSFVVAFETGLFVLFYLGFRFLERSGAGALFVNRLFAIFFLGMSFILVLSAATAAHSALFRARDVQFLLTSPTSDCAN